MIAKEDVKERTRSPGKVTFRIDEQERGRGRRNRGTVKSGAVEICGILIVIISIWVLYGLSIVLLSILRPKTTTTEKPTGMLTLKPEAVARSTFCVEPIIYTGEICRRELQERQRCYTDGTYQNIGGDNNETILIPSNIDILTIEDMAGMLTNSLLILKPSPECAMAFQQLLCLHLFGLCIEGRVVGVSQRECGNVSSSICQREWVLAFHYLSGNILPTCTELSNENTACRTNEAATTVAGTPSVNTTSCSSTESKLCQRECRELDGNHRSNVERMMAAFSVICILSTAIVTTLSCTIQGRLMLNFPDFNMVVLCFTDSILAVTILIGSSDKEFLFCSGNLSSAKQQQEEATFCNITGVVFIYCLVQWTFLGAIHSVITSWKETFPQNFQGLRRRDKPKLLVTLSYLLVLLLPLIPSLAHLRHGFFIQHSPPLFCSPQDSISEFVTTFVLLMILSAISISAIVLYLWTLTKNRILKKKMNLSISLLWIILIFVYTVYANLANLAYHITAKENANTDSNTLCRGGKTGHECEPPSVEGSLSSVRHAFISPLLLQPLIVMVILVSLTVYSCKANTSSQGRATNIS